MIIRKKKENVHFRVYVKDEKTKKTCSAGIIDHVKFSKEELLDRIIDCLNRHG